MCDRQSELFGFRTAIESIGKSSPAVPESAAWLNSLLAKIWRIKYSSSNGFGGLEPLLSSHASDIMRRLLEDSYSKPNGITHVAFDSFTFGRAPPLVQSVEIRGIDDENSVLHLGVVVGMLFDDSALMLDIRPSSLEYKTLPTTKISINSLDTQVKLDAYVKGIPDYPYISTVNITLSEIPDVNLRIIPQSESGLKGVDFGSFPVVSKWVKDLGYSTLAEYLKPQYLSINIPNWLRGDGEIISYFKE